ncbi:tail fiber domain-containing protein [Arenicella sp.]|nr:tail fiber domain-containing protein [Arenicella sp.]
MKLFLSVLLLTLVLNVSAQNSVVVVPLGSDISAQQFNELVAEIKQQRVHGGVVDAFGMKQSGGNYTVTNVSQGVYQIRLVAGAKNYGDPSIVVTPRELARIATVKSVSLELIDDDILFVDFTVELRTTSLSLFASGFSFQLKFADPTTYDPVVSDQRLKTNIKELKETTQGFRLYQFNYKESSDQQTYVGIMAQDIISDHPNEVSIDQAGHYRVNYTMLGLKMATLEDWNELGIESVELDAKLASR